MSLDRAIQAVLIPIRWIWAWAVTLIMAAGAVRADVSDDDDADYDPPPGRTEEQVEALIFNFDEVVETVVLYTALGALLVILLALAASMRLRSWVAYVVLTLVSLAWFAVYEQHATGLYWIGLDLPIPALMVIGMPLISAHFVLAGVHITPGTAVSFMRPVLLIAAVIPWVLLGLHGSSAGDSFPLSMILVASLACLSHLLVIPGFAATPGASVYTTRNYVIVSVAVVLTVLVAFGELDEAFDVSFAIRSIFVTLVLLFAFFLVQFVIALLKERDASVQRALKAAQRETEQARALLDAEKRYTRAKEVAQLHTKRLATASHDIRQPITSLRTTMATVAKGQSAEIQTQLNAAFDYLDQLAKSYMETEEASNAPERALADDGSGNEVVSSKVLTDTLDRMFRTEAEAKGLRFDVMAEDCAMSVPPLILTRILSNLLSNAIKHTQSGGIVLSAKGDAAGFVFAVQNSTALPAGMTRQELFAHGRKGDASDGSGFGLNIVEKLARDSGLPLEHSSDAENGTEFRVRIPAARLSASAQ